MPDKTEYQLKMLMKYNRDGSPDKQSARLQNLKKSFSHLQQHRGYSKRFDLHKFSRKDVNRLVHDWKDQGLSHRTIANKVADLRWLSSKIGDRDAVPKTNKELGLKQRAAPTESRAVELDYSKLDQLNERERLITELRAEFGLRTEEAIKFQHRYATQTPERIILKSSWTKGGRPREIAITNDRQRDLLERVSRHQINHGDRSMIPNDRTFKSYYRDYNEARQNAQIPGHELRHQWAQNRFKDLAEIDAPHAGGRPYSELSGAEKLRWDRAAAVVNSELGHGHGRDDITATYIGSKC